MLALFSTTFTVLLRNTWVHESSLSMLFSFSLCLFCLWNNSSILHVVFVPLSFPQLIYDAGVSFSVIMWMWAGLAGLVCLNCFLNWPAEGFATPEEIETLVKSFFQSFSFCILLNYINVKDCSKTKFSNFLEYLTPSYLKPCAHTPSNFLPQHKNIFPLN